MSDVLRSLDGTRRQTTMKLRVRVDDRDPPTFYDLHGPTLRFGSPEGIELDRRFLEACARGLRADGYECVLFQQDVITYAVEP